MTDLTNLILKCVETIVAIIILIFHCLDEYFGLPPVVSGTITGFIIILLGLCAGIIFDKEIPLEIDIYFLVVGVCMYCASGAIVIDAMIDTWGSSNSDIGISKGILCVIQAVIMVLAIIILVLHCLDEYFGLIPLCTGTFVGYVIILVGVLAGLIFQMGISMAIDLYFSIVGCILYIASGALIISDLEGGGGSGDKTMGLIKGSLAIINGIVMFIDIILVFV